MSGTLGRSSTFIVVVQIPVLDQIPLDRHPMVFVALFFSSASLFWMWALLGVAGCCWLSSPVAITSARTDRRVTTGYSCNKRHT
jgi:hypothetical protein